MTLTFQDAALTLSQCTFGPHQSDIEALVTTGSIRQWLQQQVALPQTRWVDRFDHYRNTHDKYDWTDVHRDCAFVEMTVHSEDILRLRMAYMLTQLFVVSDKDPALRGAHRRRAFCQYFDNLAERCFDDFPSLLKMMARSPVMGTYLTHLNNEYDPDGAPDENFARELLQLFTLGPALLHQDGSPVEDGNGRPVDTYSQTDIEELARVMTGWRLDDDSLELPMVDSGAHDMGQKHILGRQFAGGVDASDELDLVIDHICQHENLAPFIAKFVIQKLVSSNPSGGYVRDVALAFRDSGLQMQALLEAVLTHAEASGNHASKRMMREPFVTSMHTLRALKVRTRTENGLYANAFSWQNLNFPMTGPSVFYYYQPDESPTDPRFDHLNAPEFVLYSWLDIHGQFTALDRLVLKFEDDSADRYMDSAELWDLYTSFQDEALIERLDQLLFGASMSQGMQDALRQYCDRFSSRRKGDLKHLIRQVLMSPEFLTQG